MAWASSSPAYGRLPGTPTTYTGIPAVARAPTASIVGCESRQLSCAPLVCGLFGSGAQQLGPDAEQPPVPSMLSWQPEVPQFASMSQFGPPSVARMTYVFPGAPGSVAASAWRAAAVGVPPDLGASGASWERN